MEEVFSIPKSEAHRQGLIDRLELSQKRGSPKKFLASISYPGGGRTIMEAYRLLEETQTEYSLAPTTNKERKKLERKYSKGTGESFEYDARVALRE